MSCAIIILIDSPFHAKTAQQLFNLHREAKIFVYQVRDFEVSTQFTNNYINKNKNWNLFSFVDSSLSKIILDVRKYEDIKLYTFYETSYHFLYIKQKLGVNWSNCYIYDDGIGSCFKHSMPSRSRLFIQTILLKLLYNINVPFSKYSLGNNRFVENLVTYWPDLVSKHPHVNVKSLRFEIRRIDTINLPCDIVFLLGPILAKKRMSSTGVLEYMDNSLRKYVQPNDIIFIKPHPREDIDLLNEVLTQSRFFKQIVVFEDNSLSFEDLFHNIRPQMWVGMPSTVILNRIQYVLENSLKEKFHIIQEPNDQYPERVKFLNNLLYEKNII